MYGRIEDGTVPGPFKRLVAGLLPGLTFKADSAHVDYLSGDGRCDVSRCADATLRATQPRRAAPCGRGLARLPRPRRLPTHCPCHPGAREDVGEVSGGSELV